MLGKDTFSFNGIDMLERFGIRVVASDVLMPRLRERKVLIPGRDGAYDFGARWYDERVIRLVCDTRTGLSRQKLRELAGLLSRKGRIELWDEPGKYYVGRLYDDAALMQIGRIGHAFELAFVCEPFAMGQWRSEAIGGKVGYEATAQSPVRLTIRNGGTGTVSGVKMVIRMVEIE